MQTPMIGAISFAFYYDRSKTCKVEYKINKKFLNFDFLMVK